MEVLIIKRLSITITGVVQGVGFRPHVYRLAKKYNLSGQVNNNNIGVQIEVEGSIDNIQNFISDLRNCPPKQSRIDSFANFEIPLKNEMEFSIIISSGDGPKEVEISPDLATCAECLTDILDPTNRRYAYPFTNCTNCGPRYSIIQGRPYDRKLTSMKAFAMCDACDAEYKNPLDRRFHAQPNCCPNCGPSLHTLGINDGPSPLEAIVTKIQQNSLIAIKGIGGFNIACDATSQAAVKKLRLAKRRPNRAFAMMAKNMAAIKEICQVSTNEENALQSEVAPIVLLKKKTGHFNHISPDNNYLGIMLPYTPLHHLLMKHFDFLVMTSANKADEPIAISDEEILKLIDDKIIEAALSHNRPILHRCDDSIWQFPNGKRQVIRFSRGMVPSSFPCTCSVNTKALGANLKNSFALTKNGRIYLSQHIGDLIDYRNYQFQQKEIDNLENLLDIHPEHTICDAHPGYENFNANYHQVFHHHAHMLSVVGEHNLKCTNILGIIADGTGLGSDGKIWGFEFLLIGHVRQKFKRIAHLEYFDLIGGDKATSEIDRLAVALTAQHHYSLNNISADRVSLLKNLAKNKVNTHQTSSLGRLFDGVAAILGLTQYAEYEGQAAILLQQLAENYTKDYDNNLPTARYTPTIENMIIKHHILIAEILQDLESEVAKNEIAIKFHLWVVDTIVEIINSTNHQAVVFSGGCFQNRLLCELLQNKIETMKINYYFNEKIPINDGGISYGQAFFSE
ncbi:MAG TPA: carbamoyltransferase HypF [Bacteriovoracaceae bacterium]|nr:carbamoyltransferase HypF [Bacteriovoracaceae bacterium]